MKGLRNILHKDLLLFAADKRAIALTFLLPIALIAIFYFAFGGSVSGGNNPVLSLVLTDLDQSTASRELVTRLDTLRGLRLEETAEANSRDAVAKGRRAAALIIHPGFADSLQMGSGTALELIYDSGRSMEVGILAQLLSASISPYTGAIQGQARAKRQMMQQFGMDESTASSLLAQMGTASAEGPPPAFRTSEISAERNNDFSLIQAVAGTAVMLLLFSVAGMGAGLLSERESGTLKKLLYAPISPMIILTGKFSASLLIAIAQLMLMFLFAALAFGLDLGRNIPALLLMIFSTAMVCASLGMLLASIARSRKQLDGMSTMLILTMSAIGGSMMPVVFMPAFLQKLALGTVNYWSIQGFYDIYWRNLPFSAVLDNAGILLGLSLVLMTISALMFRRNLDRLL